MIYLLLGEDRPAKDRKINEIKADCLSCPDAVEFDYELLHAVKLDPEVLKKALIALPAIAKKRLILIHTAEKLSTHNKEILSSFIREENRHAVLVLDSDEDSLKGDFFRGLMKTAQVIRFGTGGKKTSVWDVTGAMERRHPDRALMLLNKLMEDGDPPVKIMGGLVWFWGSLKDRLCSERYNKGLLVLQEADLSIKRTRLRPEYAVEIAVTKLSSLIAC